MPDPMKTPPIPDAVRVALSYAPLGVADAAKRELDEMLAHPLVGRLVKLQAEHDELLAYARDAFQTVDAVARWQPAHLLNPQELATQFLNQHAKMSAKLA